MIEKQNTRPEDDGIWCDEALAMMNGYTPLVDRSYFILKRELPSGEVDILDVDGQVKEFETYEEAYDQMVNLYVHSLGEKHYSYADPMRYKVFHRKEFGNDVTDTLA